MDVVVAGGGAAWEESVVREVEASSRLRLVRRCVDVADLLAVASTGRVDAAIVSARLAGLDLDAVAQLAAAGLVVAAPAPEALEARAWGITTVVRLGALDELADASAPAAVRTDGPGRAPVVVVWGPAGAPGRSTVALGLAAATAARGTDTVLVDADTGGGSLGQQLAVLDDVSGLVAACRAVNNGRRHEVVDHLLPVEPGLRLLTGLPRPDRWPQVRPSAFDGVVDELRERAGLVVVDVSASVEPGTGAGPARDQTAVQALERADLVVVVGRPDPVGLARLVRGLHELATLVPEVSPLVVVNQVRSSLGWKDKEVRATVLRLAGVEPMVHLPFDQSTLDLAAISGRTPREVAPTSPFVARLEVLASLVLDRCVSSDALG